MVGNGAPGGSGLVVKDVTGTLRLPPGADGQVGTADDPLALPDLESGPQSGDRARAGRGRHHRAAARRVRPRGAHAARRARGPARRGLRHPCGALGLPVGPVALEGSAHGVVLVRNAYFDVTFTVPTVVRADEEFSVFATVTEHRSGHRQRREDDARRARASRARACSPRARRRSPALPPGDAATLEYRFRERGDRRGGGVLPAVRHERRRRRDGPPEFHARGRRAARGPVAGHAGACPRRCARFLRTWCAPRCACSGRPGAPPPRRPCRPASSGPAPRRSSGRACPWRRPGCASSWGSRWPTRSAICSLDLHGGGLDAGFDQVLRETLAGRDLDRILGDRARRRGSGRRCLGLRRSDRANRGLGSGLRVGGARRPERRRACRRSSCCATAAGRVTNSAVPRRPAVRLVPPSGPRRRRARLGLDRGARLAALHDRARGSGRRSGRGVAHAAGGRGRRAPRAARRDRRCVAGSRHRLVYDPARAGELALETDHDQATVCSKSRQPVSSAGARLGGPAARRGRHDRARDARRREPVRHVRARCSSTAW